MHHTFGSETEHIAKLATKIAKEKESTILGQLNEFISRGLIVIEEREPVITQFHSPMEREMQIHVETSVRLVLKDQEYIEKLERENTVMKNKLQSIKSAISQADMKL